MPGVLPSLRSKLASTAPLVLTLALGCGGPTPSVSSNTTLPDARPPDVTTCALKAIGACPKLIVPQVAVHRFALDATTIFLSILNNNIATVPRAGGTPALVATAPFAPNHLLPSGDLLYFATPSQSGQPNGGIYAMVKSGGPPVTLVSAVESTVFAVAWPHLYYGERLQNRILRLSLDAPDGGSSLEVFAQSTLPIVRAVDAGFVYWYEQSGGGYVLRRQAQGGNSAEIVFVESDVGLTNPVLKGDDVYWFASLSGKLQRVAKTGGPPELVYQGQGSSIVGFTRLAVAAGFAYVYDSNRTFYRVSLSTRERQTLIEDFDLQDVAADDDAVYLGLIREGIYRLPH
jgi:hypothetical protein